MKLPKPKTKHKFFKFLLGFGKIKFLIENWNFWKIIFSLFIIKIKAHWWFRPMTYASPLPPLNIDFVKKIPFFGNCQTSICGPTFLGYIKMCQFFGISLGTPPPTQRALSVKTLHQLSAIDCQNCGLWVH